MPSRRLHARLVAHGLSKSMRLLPLYGVLSIRATAMMTNAPQLLRRATYSDWKGGRRPVAVVLAATSNICCAAEAPVRGPR